MRAIGPPSFGDFCNRVHNKARSLSIAKSLGGNIDDAPNYPPDSDEGDWHNGVLDTLDADYWLEQLCNASLAQGILDGGGGSRTNDMRNCLDQEIVEARYLEAISILMPFCVGEWIAAYQGQEGHRTLRSLRNVEDFPEEFKKYLKNENTIQGEIDTAREDGDWRFPIYLLFAVDYLYYLPGDMLVYGDKVTLRPSFEILNKWSHSSWDDDGDIDDPKRMKDLAVFFGGASTIFFVAVNDTGLVRPSTTFATMEGFYGKALGSSQSPSYADAINKAIEDLRPDEEVVNEIKLWLETFADNYKSLHQDKWKAALDRASDQALESWALASRTKEYNYQTGKGLHMWCSQRVSLFSAGTQIQLADTNRHIESLKRGDRVLVSASPRKDEAIQRAPRVRKEVSLVGFNGEQPFTTVSQVFMTTTGPRAVNPRAAHAENAYQRVGRLAVGHCIYRLHGDSYEIVQIESLEITPTAMHSLYSVPVQSDQQSYHANGYLIACNDPVYSARCIAKQLQQLPEDNRLPYLVGCRELQPFFQRHGLQTATNRLDREIRDLERAPWRAASSSSSSSSRLASGGEIPLYTMQTRFGLTARRQDLLPTGYSLPDFSIVDGCVVADGQPVLQATFDERMRTFRWTRNISLPGGQRIFEHASLTVYPDGGAGSGVVYLSRDANPVQVDIENSREQLHTFNAVAICPCPREEDDSLHQADRNDLFRSNRDYTLTFDKEIWPEGKPWDGVKTPIEGGKVRIGATQVTDEDYAVQTSRISDLDNLQQQINSKYEKNLDRLYRTTMTHAKDDTAVYTIQMHRASWIPFLASDWSSGNSDSNFNVKFKPELNVDVTLPCLFSELRLNIDTMFPDDSVAELYEYDPNMRGMKGNRHFVQVKLDQEEVRYFQDLRARVSRASSWFTTHNYKSPAPVTESLRNYADLSVSNLINFSLYSDQVVHDTSQNLIHSMMLYHMDQDDRDQFTTENKPTNLPTELAEGLGRDLKTFLHDKYAPAWLCQSFAASDKYADQFTSQQQKKLWYWWHGNGKRCLARSKEYNDINKLTSVHGVRAAYKSWIGPYVEDNPGDWAQRMLAVLQDPLVVDYQINSPIQPRTGQSRNIVNQQATVMHALAPDQNLSDAWFAKILAFSMERGMENPTISADEKQARQWLSDTVGKLIEKSISDDGTLAPDIRVEMLADIKQYEQTNGLDQSQSAQQRATEIVQKESALLDELAEWVSVSVPGSVSTTAGKREGVDDAYQSSSLWQWISEAWDQVSEKYQASKILKGVFTTGMAAYKMFSIAYSLVGLIKDWDEMSDADKAQVIMSMVGEITEGLDFAMEAWKTWKGRTGMAVLDQLDTMEMDQGTYQSVRENADSLVSTAEKVSGDEGIGVSIGEKVTGEGGVPTEGTEEEGAWNKPLEELPNDMPPGGEEAASEFGMEGKLMNVLSIALGLAIAIVMTFSLVHDWDNMSTADKVINVLSLVVQVLSVTLEITDLGIEAGLWAVSATMAAALPVIGAVLAVLGIILALVSLLVSLFGGGEKDPIEDYIDGTGGQVIDSFDNAPAPRLDYSVSPADLPSGNVSSVTITGTNQGSEDVSLAGVTISILSGDDKSCLFSDTEKIVLVEDQTTAKDRVYVAPKGEAAGDLPFRTALDADGKYYYRYALGVGGPKKENESLLQQLVIKPAARFSATWSATANMTGRGQTAKVDVVEKTRSDMAHALLKVSLV